MRRAVLRDRQSPTIETVRGEADFNVLGKEPRDYMVCMKTGKHLVFSDADLIKLHDRICKRHGWNPVGHRFHIYAISPEGSGSGDDQLDSGNNA